MTKNGRKAKKMTIDELKEFIMKKMRKIDEETEFDFEEGFDIYDLIDAFPKIEKDIFKIDFDMENYDIEKEDLIGFNTIEEFSFLGVSAGGDWEMPVFFLLYVDHKNTLRGYVPTEGNVFNKKTKAAFGNDEEEDEKEAKKQGFNNYEDMEFDWNKLKEDIKNRIMIV